MQSAGFCFKTFKIIGYLVLIFLGFCFSQLFIIKPLIFFFLKKEKIEDKQTSKNQIIWKNNLLIFFYQTSQRISRLVMSDPFPAIKL